MVKKIFKKIIKNFYTDKIRYLYNIYYYTIIKLKNIFIRITLNNNIIYLIRN